jgi:hypothetical protein
MRLLRHPGGEAGGRSGSEQTIGTRGGSRGRTGPPPGLSAPEVTSQGMRRPIDSAGSQASDDRVIGQAAQLNLRETSLGSSTIAHRGLGQTLPQLDSGNPRLAGDPVGPQAPVTFFPHPARATLGGESYV